MQFFLSHVNGYDDIVDQRPHLIPREAKHVLAHQLYQKRHHDPTLLDWTVVSIHTLVYSGIDHLALECGSRSAPFRGVGQNYPTYRTGNSNNPVNVWLPAPPWCWPILG